MSKQSPRKIKPEDAADILRPHETVFITAGAAESRVFCRALQGAPERAAHVTFIGVFIPGFNDFDYANLHPDARAEGIFAVPAFRASFQSGRYRIRPMHYFEAARHLAGLTVDLAVVHVSLPDIHGFCSFGISADFAPLVLKNAKRVVAIVNPAMPMTTGEPGLAWDRIDYVIDVDEPLAAYPSAPRDAVTSAIGENIAGIVRDGDTIQIGLGKMAAASLRALTQHRNLGVHSGMIIDEIVALRDCGALRAPSEGRKPIVTGCAIGTAPLHALAAETDFVDFRTALYTHNGATISRIDNFVSINSALCVDLFGQVNAEWLAGQLMSGVGGMADFVRGARASPGGRSVIALPARSNGQARIVPCLPDKTTTLARSDIDIVVTEFGAAHLRHLTLEERAEALINIAAPDDRNRLAEEWKRLRDAV